MKNIIVILMLVLVIPNNIYSKTIKYKVKGVVIDDEMSETLPIVNVSINGNAFRGTQTDPRGYFTIDVKKNDKFLLFTYVGFQSQKFILTTKILKSKKPIEIRLKTEDLSIGEVVISAKVNPAYRIIKNVTKNQQKYNPDNLPLYKTHVYSKIKVKLDLDTTYEDKSFFNGVYEVFDDYYMYLSETVYEKYCRPYNDVKNVIIANKIAGYELPKFNFNFESLQPFHFYDNFIEIYNKRYLNPISEGAEDGYYFALKDTVTMKNGRVSYVINFFPESFVNFNALKGTLYIDTLDFAIAKVNAAPNIKEIVDLQIEQEYNKVNDSIWFPSLLKFQLYWTKFPDKYANILVFGETYPSDLTFDSPDLDSIKFDEFANVTKKHSIVLDSTFWKKERIQSLNEDEVRSYLHIDSISKEYHIEEVTNAVGKILTEFYLPLGYFNIDLSKVYYFDNYQRHRFGFGATTSQLLSNHFMLGGYCTYGVGDDRWKHGADFIVTFDDEKLYKLKFSYYHDMEEPTRNYLTFDRRYDIISDLIIDRYNNTEEFKVSFMRRVKFFKYQLILRNQIITPKYKLEQNIDDLSHKYTEFGFNLKYANKEKILPLFGEEMILESKEPIYYLIYQQGVKNILNSQYEYYRLAVSAKRNFDMFRYGQLQVQLEAGIVSGSDLTYHKLFSGRGSNHDNFTFLLLNTFQTMYQYEFTNNKYFNIFLRHRFEPLTFNSEYFKPTVSISQNIGFGWLNKNISDNNRYLVNEFGVPYTSRITHLVDMHKGYFETGISISNIARVKVFSFGYFGAGFNLYYRWGPYSYAKQSDNLKFVFGFAYSL